MARPDIIPLYTYEDYKLWEGDWELIAGHPIAMSPSPKKNHQRIARNISYIFMQALNLINSNYELLYEIDWLIDEKHVVRPDIILATKKEGDFIEDKPILIVEILSPATKEKDINTKYNLYQSQGVKYYIIVDPELDSIEIYLLAFTGVYELVKAESDSLHFILDDVTCIVDLSAVFR